MASAEEYAAWIVKNADKKGSREFDKVAQAYQIAKSSTDSTGMGAADVPWYENAAAGVGKAIYDAARGAGQLVGAVSREDVAKSREMDAPLMNTKAGLAGNVAGNIGIMLAPGGVLKGAGMVAKAAGAGDAAAALSTAGGTLLAPTTVKAALPVGAAMGLIQPSTSTKETALNTGIGAVATAAAPLLVKGAQAAKAAAEPFYEGGQNQILGRVLNKVAGADAPAVQANLAAAREIVPGSAPTVGQAGGNAGVAALERTATAAVPETTNAVSERMAAQNAARVAALEGVSGTQAARDAAEAARSAKAGPLYKAAREAGIDPAAAKALKPQIDNLMERMPAGVMEKARELARINGETLGKDGSVDGLHWMKIAVDDLISGAGASGMGAQTKRALTQFKGDLLSVIEDLSPAYAKAKDNFAALSKPLNEMQVGAEIANKSVNKLTGNLQPAAYARSLSDETAARATGFSGSTLTNTLSPNKLVALQAIKDDLARAEAAKTAGRGVGSDTVQKLAYSNFIDAAGIPTFLRNLAPAQVAGNLASRGADALYGRANKEMASRLAQIMLEPKDAAAVMKIASQPGNEKLLQLISGGGSAVGLAATPALIHAQQ